MQLNYQKLVELLRDERKRNRDRNVRVKVELILLAARLGNVNEACARRGFSRKFFYKWWGRLKRARFQLHGLAELSRRPRRSPNRISYKVEQKIRQLHAKGYGALMIHAFLKREQMRASVSTIGHVLNRRRKIKRRVKNKLVKAHNRRYELYVPGQRLQLDVKYVPEFVEGRRVYNFVAVDECTRWRFAKGYFELSAVSCEDFLKELKRACPFPIHCLQTDNGFEFTYRLMNKGYGAMPEHLMERWCKQNQVRHRCIPPGEKELNGKVERSHRLDEQYFYWKAPTDTLKNFNQALGTWIRFYNAKRPHGGLGFITPDEKLTERKQTLSQTRFEGEQELLEPLRIKFIEHLTIKNMSKEDRELLHWLNEAKKYQSAA